MEAEVSLPGRREKRKQEIRGRILDAAYELFRDYGIEATSVEQICTSADVARRTFYGYYNNKESLLRDLSQQRTYATAEEMFRSLSDEEQATSDRVIAMINFLEKNLADYGDIDRQLMLVRPGPEDEHNPLHELSDSLQDKFREILAHGQQRGDTSTEFSPEILAEMVMGTVNSLMVHWASDTSYPLFEKLAEARRLFTAVLSLPIRH